MKTMRGKIIGVLVLVVLFLMLGACKAHAEEAEELKKGCSTAYCLKGKTASGIETRCGICAGASKYLGKMIIIYQRLPDDSVGKMLGVFECKDTGGTDAIRNGYCIDVWFPDHDTCQGWMNLVYMDGCKGKIYFKVVENVNIQKAE